MKLFTRISVFSLIDLVLTCGLAYTYLSLWRCPQASDVEKIYNLSVLMAFEFIMVHSGVFMSVLGRSWKGWLCAIILYGLFAFVFNLFITNNYILLLYGGVVLNRVLSGVMTKDETENSKKAVSSALYALVYFFLMMFVAVYSFMIPEWGLTDDFLQSSGYRDIVIIGGILTDTPHTSMCFGMLYYMALSLMAVFTMFRQPAKTPLKIEIAEKTAPKVSVPAGEEVPFFHPRMALGFGIVSILLCWFIVFGAIIGIIGFVASFLTIKEYKTMPEKYSRKSYLIARIGKICSIIGLIFGVLFSFGLTFFFL